MGKEEDIDHGVSANYISEDNPILKAASILLIDVDPPYEASLTLGFGKEGENTAHLESITVYLPSLLARLGQEGRERLYEALKSFRDHMRDV